MRMGLLSAVAIALHNFPEGIATFVAALDHPKLGVEHRHRRRPPQHPGGDRGRGPDLLRDGKPRAGVLLVVPVRPLRARSAPSWPGCCSRGLLGGALRGVLFAAVAGVMVFISFDELLPTAREYGEHHVAIYGLTSGMAVMAVSLAFMV